MTFTHFSSLFTFHWFSRFSNVISKWENSYYFWIQIFTHYLSNFCSKVKSKYFNGCSFWSLVLPSIFSIRRQWAFSADDFSQIFFSLHFSLKLISAVFCSLYMTRHAAGDFWLFLHQFTSFHTLHHPTLLI